MANKIQFARHNSVFV